MLRHSLATLAYRGGKAVRGAPAEFANYSGAGRTPGQILAHMGDLLDWALTITEGKEQWRMVKARGWEEDVARFHASLKALDDRLASDAPIPAPLERIFQGPVADALTHVGQIAMLRRMSGSPMRGENYYVADIAIGQVSADQPRSKQELG